MIKIMFEPDLSSLEDIVVSWRERSIIFKRGVAVDCPDDLAKSLLEEPAKFKAVESQA